MADIRSHTRENNAGRVHNNLLDELLLSLCLTEDLDCWFSDNFHLSPTARGPLALHSLLLKFAGDVCCIHVFYVVPHCIQSGTTFRVSKTATCVPLKHLEWAFSGFFICFGFVFFLFSSHDPLPFP